MRGRAIIPLVVGLGVGIFAIKMFVDVLQNARGSNTSEMVDVVSTAADISPTVEITGAMISTKKVPKALAPKMSFVNKEEVIGRVVSMFVPNGSAITANLLAPKGTLPGLTVLIPEGYRAVAVKIDEYAGVGGWLKPKARVDVVAMMVAQGGGKRQTICRTLLQDVQVLAVGQNQGNNSDPTAAVTKSVTLAVRPSDVPRLHLASSQNGSKLRLAMRGQSDRAMQDEMTTTDNELFVNNVGRNTGAGLNAGSDSQSSFLNRMLTEPSKNNGDATDKESSASGLTAASVRNEWVVEVINGANVQYVRFDGSDVGARRLSGKERRFGPPVGAFPSGARSLPVSKKPTFDPSSVGESVNEDAQATPAVESKE